jgi:hypothetical protein
MRAFSESEKSIIRRVVEVDRSVFSIRDFLEMIWTEGQLDIDNVSQVVTIKRSRNQSMEQTMEKLVGLLQLIKYLEVNGYVHSWAHLHFTTPVISLGQAEGDPEFLSDLTVSVQLLNQSAKAFSIHQSLIDLVNRGFQDHHQYQLKRTHQNILIALIVVLLINLAGVGANFYYTNLRSSQNFGQLKDRSEILSRNQHLSRKILDTLSVQNQQLLLLTKNISNNTQDIHSLKEQLQFIQRDQQRALTRYKQLQSQLLTKIETIRVRLDSLER